MKIVIIGKIISLKSFVQDPENAGSCIELAESETFTLQSEAKDIDFLLEQLSMAYAVDSCSTIIESIIVHFNSGETNDLPELTNKLAYHALEQVSDVNFFCLNTDLTKY